MKLETLPRIIFCTLAYVAGSLGAGAFAADIPSVQSKPIYIRDAANRGLRDDVAGDGKGGWTDQGPDNDLSSLRPGMIRVSDVSFKVVDPVENRGRSVIVLGRASQQVASDAGEATREATDITKSAAASATVKISGAPKYRFIYLLHAAANVPKTEGVLVGSITARYADGTESRVEVKNRIDVGNWRDPATAVNAGIAWESENPTASIGLYASRFQIEEKPLVSLTFGQEGIPAWMIVAVTASLGKIDVGVVAKDFVIQPGAEWAPYKHSLDIEKGSVFDFSVQLDAPAGKHGAIRATPDGHFEFENNPGVRARFWGVNLCFTAQYLDKKDADLMAERFARSGYNTVRFHHFDGGVIRKGGNSWELDPAALDKLEYLFAALKKRGIYINIDLFASRGFSAAEADAWGVSRGNRDAFKALMPINNAVFESWRRFAQNLLTHKNPYTGLTWAEDPALIGICPVNENPLFNRVENNPEIYAAYKAAFAKAKLPGEPNSKNPAFNQFIHELNARADARMFEYLRSLNVKALLTGANYTIALGLIDVRAAHDYVDCHSYWDHPKFPVKSWAPPFAFGQGSAIKARAKMPNRIMPTRVFGKPFVTTEFNFCRPNKYRFEGAVLMPAYASLQDWDALYNFQYAMSEKMAIHGGVENYFAIATDPIGLIGDRVGSFVFQRGDIAPAKRAIAYAAAPAEKYAALGNLFPGDFTPLGLVARIGSLPGAPADALARYGASQKIDAIVTGKSQEHAPAKIYLINDALPATLARDSIIPRDAIAADCTRYTSDTGQIELRPGDATVKAIAPRSEHFLLAPGSKLDGDRVFVANGDTRCAVSVVSLATRSDSAAPALADARRILITHLTNALPDGMVFAHTDMKLLKKWGRGPHLVERGDTTLTLRLPAGKWRAWAVDATGKRTREIPLVRESTTDGAHAAFTLRASTITPEGTQLAYELAR